MSKTNVKNNFFNFEKEVKSLKIDLDKDAGLICFTAPRNNGKTHSTFTYIIDDCLKNNKSFVAMRTTVTEIDALKNMIKTKFTQLIVSNDLIYEKIEEIDEENEEEPKIKKGRIIGYLVALTGSTKFKSAFENDNQNHIKFVIYDEYNDIKLRQNLYEEFVNLMRTIKRYQSNFWVILLGNKDNSNNPFLLEWGIRAREISEKYVKKLAENMFYIEYPQKYFNITEDDFISNLASFNEEMNRYLNEGGFRKTSIENIIKYDIWIKPNIVKKLYNVIIRKKCYEMGIFNDPFTNTTKNLYIRDIDFKNRDLKLNTFAVGIENILGSKITGLDEEEVADIARLIENYKNRDKLFFTSFSGFLDVNQELYIIKKYNSEYD